MDDVTLDETASDTEQPVQEAVDPAPVDSAPPATEPASTEQPAFTSRTYAGKYQSPEELERAYLESTREASRMAGELSALKRADSPAASAEPKWKQLDAERNKWAQQLRNPGLDEAQRWQADEQVRLYDREIAYERARADNRQDATRQTAATELERESTAVFEQYKDDLNNERSPLYQASRARFQQLLDAGYPDTVNTKAMAVSFAAVRTGAGTAKAIQTDRSAMLKTLNQQVKQAVVAGAGGPSPVKTGGVSARDIEAMSPKEFAKYEREILGV